MTLNCNTGATTSIAFIDHGIPRQTQTPTTSNYSGLISGVAVTIIFIFMSTVMIITAVVMIKQRSKKTFDVTSGMALSNQVYGEFNYRYNIIQLLYMRYTITSTLFGVCKL